MADYSLADRLLHRLALGPRILGDIAFDVEKSLYLKTAPSHGDKPHVFVSGLARAGTTILMRALYDSGQFASLTYNDMPFVLCPNLWSRVSGLSQSKRPAQERAHGDGIMVDVQSPEALDEVFWRVFEGKTYIHADKLVPHTPAPETIHAYGDYMRLVMRRHGKARYLTKNNNTILRLPAIRESFANAIFLIPLRDPLAHAHSLLAQHIRFRDADEFTQSYMPWLGHHEFGATHRPFRLPVPIEEIGTPNELDYWIQQWIQYYTYVEQLLDRAPERCYLIPYEDLCAVPEVWARLAEIVQIDLGDCPQFRISDRSLDPACAPERLRLARQLYSRLQDCALEQLACDRAPSKSPQ